jgi:hypothetical protein
MLETSLCQQTCQRPERANCPDVTPFSASFKFSIERACPIPDEKLNVEVQKMALLTRQSNSAHSA